MTKMEFIISVFRVPNKYNYVNQRKIKNVRMQFIFKRKKYSRRQKQTYSLRTRKFILCKS